MASTKQIRYIKELYHQLGQESEDDIENCNNKEAQKIINELKELLAEQKRLNSSDDNCYWY